ncbi:unnamed protein product [Withania somnifera]
MKVSPKKPHFFKPILPNFQHGIKIPDAFSKYLKGCNQEHAILRMAGEKEHDLQLGDLLIFRYEGKMEFEVSVFSSNHFEREYEGEEEINHTCKNIISQGL